MAYRLGALLVVLTYMSGTSALRSCICTKEMNPVCGSDGQTYSNICMLNCQRKDDPTLTVDKLGPCRSKREHESDICVCTLEYHPVCGSNGQTYPNKCSLECEGGNVRLVHSGNCRQKREAREPPACFCTFDYNPVCGSNGQTYANLCELNCEGGTVDLAHSGECTKKREVQSEPESCLCTLEYNPVCGSNGRTYGNKCELACEGGAVHLAYPGECKVKRQSLPSCACTREGNPVCGTDGRTYSNPCLLNCARQQNGNLHIEHPGSCKK